MEDLELLQGTVATVVFQNPENGYAVLRLNCAGQIITVVGTIPLAVPGERPMVTGRWTNNAQYGRQLAVRVWMSGSASLFDGGIFMFQAFGILFPAKLIIGNDRLCTMIP